MKNLILSTLVIFTFTSPAAFAAKDKTTKASKVEWTTEQRENMAKMHENMAACLRSTKTMKDCRAEMRTTCHDMGGENCPMMERHGMKWEE
ncbi:MAG: hypothetical protein ACM3MG_02075 [Bacillota bacterium]